jgi:hypothetical protein
MRSDFGQKHLKHVMTEAQPQVADAAPASNEQKLKDMQDTFSRNRPGPTARQILEQRGIVTPGK